MHSHLSEGLFIFFFLQQLLYSEYVFIHPNLTKSYKIIQKLFLKTSHVGIAYLLKQHPWCAATYFRFLQSCINHF